MLIVLFPSLMTVGRTEDLTTVPHHVILIRFSKIMSVVFECKGTTYLRKRGNPIVL